MPTPDIAPAVYRVMFAIALIALVGFLLGACGTPTPAAPAPAPQAAPQAVTSAPDGGLGLEEAMAEPEAAELAVATCDALRAGYTYAEVRQAVTDNIDFTGLDFTPDNMLSVMLLAGCPEYL